MRLVYNIDLVLGARGRGANVFLEVADLVDAAIGCRVDLHHVERFLRVDCKAFTAFVARFAKRGERRIRAALLAIEQLCDQPRRRRLTSPTRAVKDVGLPKPPRLRGVLEDLNVCLLAEDVVELLRAVFAVEGLCHVRLLYAGNALVVGGLTGLIDMLYCSSLG